jgi:hypothetical protein
MYDEGVCIYLCSMRWGKPSCYSNKHSFVSSLTKASAANVLATKVPTHALALGFTFNGDKRLPCVTCLYISMLTEMAKCYVH